MLRLQARCSAVLAQLSPLPGVLELLAWKGWAPAIVQPNSITVEEGGEALVTPTLTVLYRAPHAPPPPPDCTTLFILSAMFLSHSCGSVGCTPVAQSPEPTQLGSSHWHDLAPLATGD